MASWGEKMGRMAQNAVAKSKEMAEITRLNVEISNLEQSLRDNYIQLGQYVLSHPDLIAAEDETVVQIRQSVTDLQAKVEQDRQTICDLRNVNICSNCGAEVSRSSKFCDKCGTAMDRPVLTNRQEENHVCPSCGAEVENGAAFCGSCGAKLEK